MKKESFTIKTEDATYQIEPKIVLGRPDGYIFFNISNNGNISVRNGRTNKDISGKYHISIVEQMMLF